MSNPLYGYVEVPCSRLHEAVEVYRDTTNQMYELDCLDLIAEETRELEAHNKTWWAKVFGKVENVGAWRKRKLNKLGIIYDFELKKAAELRASRMAFANDVSAMISATGWKPRPVAASPDLAAEYVTVRMVVTPGEREDIYTQLASGSGAALAEREPTVWISTKVASRLLGCWPEEQQRNGNAS